MSEVGVPPIVAAIRSSKRELARLLTRIENGAAAAELSALFPYTGHAHIIGVTGAPGTGKSSLVNALALHYRKVEQRTVGIIAVDPTSPFSGGAVLGDRIRMRDLSGDPGVFIRSMATRGSLGGIARTTTDLIHAFDAAQFDIVLVETVGAGQSEVDIARAAQTTLVIEAPGLGDDVQAIKAGILEIADILVINKADHPGLEATLRALRAMLDLGHRAERVMHHGRAMTTAPTVILDENKAWQTPIAQTVATENRGVPELVKLIADHRAYLGESGLLAEREKGRATIAVTDHLRELLLARLLAEGGAERLAAAAARVSRREIDPAGAAREVLNGR